jgi:hypothetical protein
MCAGTAGAPTVIVCAFPGFPGGMWQIVTLASPAPAAPGWLATSPTSAVMPSKPRSHQLVFLVIGLPPAAYFP